jgi:hypothetical protein
MKFNVQLLILVLTLSAASEASAQLTCTDLDGASVYSDESSPVYLGFFGNNFASESINNQFGTYGSEFNSLSVRNTFGNYGSSFGTYSANNSFTFTPPNIWKHGVIIARLTTNTSVIGNVSLAVIDASCTFYASSPTTFSPELPFPFIASDGIIGGVNLSWPPTLGAEIYEVYRNTVDSFASSIYLGYVTTAGAVDTSATPNVTYYYWVAACNTFGCTISLPDTGFASAEAMNVPPVASAGSDQTVVDNDDSGSEQVTLNGNGSSDSDGSIIDYQWFEGASQIASGSSPTVDLDVGVHNIILRVTDNDSATDEDSVVIEVQAAPPPPPFTGIVSLGDLNGNGSSDVGVAVPGSTRVHIRDGSTDVLITDIDFGEDTAFDLAVLPDLDGSGDPEIAILQQQASGQVRVQARDSVTGSVTKNLWYGQQYEPVSMDVVSDYSGNSLPEVAVLGSEAGTDAVRVQIQDTSTGFLDNVFLGTQSHAKPRQRPGVGCRYQRQWYSGDGHPGCAQRQQPGPQPGVGCRYGSVPEKYLVW